MPGEWPVVGHLPTLLQNPISALKRAHETLGPLFWVNMGFGLRSLFCLGVEGFELLKRKEVISGPAFARTFLHIAGPSSLPSNDGHEHAHLRSAIGPFFSPGNMDRKGIVQSLADIISERVIQLPEGRNISLLAETYELALDLIFTVIGVPQGDLPIWRTQYRKFALGMYPIPIMFPGFPRYRSARAKKWVDGRLVDMIDNASARASGGNLVNTLIAARDDEGMSLSKQEIIDNLRVVTWAGHETTGSIMAWSLVVLANEPKLWNALVDEVRKASGAEVPGTFAEAKNYPLAGAIAREVIRYYAPVWFTVRETTDWITLYDRRIPPRTPICVSPALTSREPSIFPNPDCFDHSRWLTLKGPPPAIMMSQFGGGHHFCIGYSLAWIETLQFVLAVARRGLRPRLLAGFAPKQRYFPVGHPQDNTKMMFA